MTTGSLQELLSDLTLLLYGGARGGDRLGRHARALHRLAAQAPAVRPLAEAAEKALTAPGPRALHDLGLLLRQARAGLAGTDADGAIRPVEPSGPWATPLAPDALGPLVEALRPAAWQDRDTLMRAAEAARPDLRLAGPLLAGLAHRTGRSGEYLAAEALPALAPGLAGELRRGLDLRGGAADARRLAALYNIDPKSAAEFCRAALAEGSDVVKAQAVQCLACEGPDEGERAALDVLRQKKARGGARQAALRALAPSREDEALEHLLAGLARPGTAWQATQALLRGRHPGLAARLLEAARAAADKLAAGPPGPAPPKQADYLRNLLILLAQRGGPAGVRQILALADHPSEAVRATAVAALNQAGTYGPLGPDAVAELVAALGHKEERVRAAAVGQLGGIGRKAKAAVPALIEALRKDPMPSVRSAVATALGQIGQPREEVLKALCQALWDRDAGPSGYAAHAIGSLGAKARPAVPELLGLLRRGAPDQRSSVLDALGFLGPLTREVVLAVVAALRDPDASVRCNAARVLIALGVRAKDAVPALTDMLSSTDGWTRRYAAEALGKLGPAAAPAVEALAAVLLEPDPVLRHYGRVEAAEALGAVGPAARAAVPALLKARRDRNKQLRAAIDEALEALTDY
jgi:HEAT repeat protein